MRLIFNSLKPEKYSGAFLLIRKQKEQVLLHRNVSSTKRKSKPVSENQKPITRKKAMQDHIETLPLNIQKTLFSEERFSTNYKTCVDYLDNSFCKGIFRDDRLVLVNPDTAKRIVKSILKHSVHLNSDDIKNKVVYGADGNLCLVPMELRKQLSNRNIHSEITVLEKSDLLREIHPRETLKELDINVYPSAASLTRMNFESREFGYDYPNCLQPLANKPEFPSWDHPTPAYVYVGVTGIGNISVLAYHYLYRKITNSFFAKTRPEFFVLMNPMSFFTLAGGEPKIERSPDGTIVTNTGPVSPYRHYPSDFQRSIPFRLCFDYTLLDLVPSKDFMSWKHNLDIEPTKPRSNTKIDIVSNRYWKDLALVHITPKLDPGINLDRPGHIKHFLKDLSSSHILYSSVLPVFEHWIPGFGLELFNRGHDVFTASSELSIDDIRYLYNQLVNHPQFHHSNFEASSETQQFYENKLKVQVSKYVKNSL